MRPILLYISCATSPRGVNDGIITFAQFKDGNLSETHNLLAENCDDTESVKI